MERRIRSTSRTKRSDVRTSRNAHLERLNWWPVSSGQTTSSSCRKASASSGVHSESKVTREHTSQHAPPTHARPSRSGTASSSSSTTPYPGSCSERVFGACSAGCRQVTLYVKRRRPCRCAKSASNTWCSSRGTSSGSSPPSAVCSASRAAVQKAACTVSPSRAAPPPRRAQSMPASPWPRAILSGCDPSPDGEEASAPLETSNSASSCWPISTAAWSGVLPPILAAFGSAPCASSSAAISRCPFRAAMCSGVLRLALSSLLERPALRSRSTALMSPAAAAS
mmetsp:Transcript_36865/g.118902  ORF Transcript_36865/g.118902 Transcript_36865/m.118902 type:complete len:282 (-) Transcript_36865:220-1065(-)